MKKQKLPMAPPIQTIESTELAAISAYIASKLNVEKIICFGSIIRNITRKSSFIVEQLIINNTDLNSYSILIAPSGNEHMPDVLIQQRMEEELKHLANVTIIVHRMEEINTALQNGSTFFTTLYKNGNLIYDSQQEPFAVPAAGAAISKRIQKREKFWAHWSELQNDFLIGARFYASINKNPLAIFMLHQALQHCYSGVLRVFIGYRTNANSLRRLMKLIETALPEYKLSSFKATPEDARLTGILLKGFGEARYSDKFAATEAEVATLIERIADILQSSNSSCLIHLEGLKAGKTSDIAAA
jgi:HEPN domain-containing protein